jgi:hypothetical protein
MSFMGVLLLYRLKRNGFRWRAAGPPRGGGKKNPRSRAETLAKSAHIHHNNHVWTKQPTVDLISAVKATHSGKVSVSGLNPRQLLQV